MQDLSLPRAPGAKAAKVCGILAIVFAFTCVGFPVAVVLGIVALVQHSKARRLVREQPEAYRPVPATGLVTGIVGLVLPVFLLPVAGIVSAIAIPALLSQRSRARDKAAIEALAGGTADLIGEYDRLAEVGTPKEAIPAALEAKVKTLGAQDSWDPALPAYAGKVGVVEGLDRTGVEEAARARATVLGQTAFVLELPRDGQPGYLAGAVSCRTPVAGQPIVVKVVELD